MGNRLVLYYCNADFETSAIEIPVTLKDKIHGIICQNREIRHGNAITGCLVVIYGGREIMSLLFTEENVS